MDTVTDTATKIKLDAGQQRVVLENMGLAYSYARKYLAKAARQMRGVKMAPYLAEAEQDLTQAALTGLCVAAIKFEPERGLQFSTFATWCIRTHVADAARRLLMRTAKNFKSKIVTLAGGFPGVGMPGAGKADAAYDVWCDDQEDEGGDGQAVAALLRKYLSERDSTVLIDRLINGLTLKAIGEKQGCSKQRVNEITLRALSRVRRSRLFLEELDLLFHRSRQYSTKGDFRGSGIATNAVRVAAGGNREVDQGRGSGAGQGAGEQGDGEHHVGARGHPGGRGQGGEGGVAGDAGPFPGRDRGDSAHEDRHQGLMVDEPFAVQ